MLMVNGPLEIYSTIIGIKLFDSLFNILATIGIVFIPLVVLLVSNLSKPFESEIENGASTSLRTLTINVVTWVITVMLFVTPTWPLKAKEIIFSQACYPNAVDSSAGDTGTTLDQQFGYLEDENLRLPLAMAFVLTGMSGFTGAAIESLPCKTDVQQIHDVINTTTLPHALLKQVSQFNRQCFAPAKAKFNAHPPKESVYEPIMKRYGGESDLNWMGSHTMQELYYYKMRARTPIEGYPYDQYPDPYREYNDSQGVPHSEYGFPDCQTWWDGIKSAIVNKVDDHDPKNPHLGRPALTKRLSNWMAEVRDNLRYGTQATPEDIIVYRKLYHNTSFEERGADIMGRSGFSDFTKMFVPSADSAYELSGVAIQGISSVESFFKRQQVMLEVPAIQSVLIAFSLMLGPIIICLGLFSGRAVQVICTYYFIVSSLYFLTFIERFLHYLEVSLRASETFSLYSVNQHFMLYNVFTKLYFFCPMLYFGLMSIAGIEMGRSMGSSFKGSVSEGPSSLVSLASKFIK